MSSIEGRDRDGKAVWRAHYRTPDGRQHNKTFDRKVDAARFLTTVESSKLNGSYIDPSRARLTVREWSRTWLLGRANLKPTCERYEGIVNTHIVPRWGDDRLADVSHSQVQTRVTELSAHRSPATVIKIHRVLSMIFDLAVRDERLVRNPAAGIRLPRIVPKEHIYLTHDQVDQLATVVASPYAGRHPCSVRRPGGGPVIPVGRADVGLHRTPVGGGGGTAGQQH